MTENMEQYYKILRQDYEEQAEYLKEIRALKHDMQAHLIVLQYYLDAGKYEEAKEYLQDMKEHQELVKRPQVETGNPMVDAVITQRWKQSREEIRVSCEGELPQKMHISEYDLCTMISNLFSNAVEACERLKNREKEIDIKIWQKADGWGLEMANPVEWLVDENLIRCGTAKEDKENHGFGVGNVIQAVKKNGGNLNFFVEDGIFRVHVVFPGKERTRKAGQ